MSLNLVVLSICILAMLGSYSAEFTAEDCWALGMNKANLLCSTCDLLTKHNLHSIKENCLNCCTKEEVTAGIKRYPKASLEVCTCKFGAYPQIQAFVKSSKPKQFPNLSIRYVRGLDPIIKLLDEQSNVQEVLAIERWDTDAIEEFLRTHLETTSSESDDYLKTNKV